MKKIGVYSKKEVKAILRWIEAELHFHEENEKISWLRTEDPETKKFPDCYASFNDYSRTIGAQYYLKNILENQNHENPKIHNFSYIPELNNKY